MATEPQPRTYNLTVAEADAKGLVRNSLIDSAANWDSVGKGKLRKGFLQTLDAAENYVNEGPIGQAVEELLDFRDAFYRNRLYYLDANQITVPGGQSGLFPSPLGGGPLPLTWHYSAKIQWIANDNGEISFTSVLPPAAIAYSWRHVRELTPEEGVITGTGTGTYPTIAFESGSNDNILDIDMFVTVNPDEYEIITVNIDVDNSGIAAFKAGSFAKVELAYLDYPQPAP